MMDSMDVVLGLVFILIGLRVAWFFATPVLWILTGYFLIVASDAQMTLGDSAASGRSFGLAAACFTASLFVRAVKA